MHIFKNIQEARLFSYDAGSRDMSVLAFFDYHCKRKVVRFSMKGTAVDYETIEDANEIH